MTNERLEELKQLVIDGLYVDETGEEEVFEHFHTISTTQQDDLLTVLNEAIDRAEPNNFERWKAGLTIDYLAKHEIIPCVFCPAQTYCGTQPESKGCGTIVKEWGNNNE